MRRLALAAAYGPDWQHIAALIHRAAAMTATEARRLTEVFSMIAIQPWDSKGTRHKAAINAAWNASSDAAVCAGEYRAIAHRETIRFAMNAVTDAMGNEAAERLTWDDCWDVALDATAHAISGLCVRDLIGQSPFTQERYDALTHLWRAVIGPVHPDDSLLECRVPFTTAAP